MGLWDKLQRKTGSPRRAHTSTRSPYQVQRRQHYRVSAQNLEDAAIRFGNWLKRQFEDMGVIS